MIVAPTPINQAAERVADAEMSLVGLVMEHPKTWSTVELVGDDDFSDPVLLRMWQAARVIFRDGGEPAAEVMWSALGDDAGVLALGGAKFLFGLIERAPPATAAASIASTVAGNGMRRRIANLIRPGLTAPELRRSLAEELDRPEPVIDGKRLRASPLALPAPADIPPREWLYARHLIRGYVSCTVAPGGLGKSSLVLAEALAMVTRRPLLDEHVHEPLRVWYYNGEDDNLETQRRIAALCILHGIASEDIGDRLFCDSGRITPITLARETRDGFTLNGAIEKQILTTLREQRIDVMIIDPFVSIHEVGENDNAQINAIVRALNRVAERSRAAIEIVHHVRKPGGGDKGETRVEDARGASSLIGAVRSARVLNVMSEQEAARADITERFQHFRVDNGKANMAPRSELATWRRIRSIDLGNGRGAYPGDKVGAVEAWRMPGALDLISVEQAQAMQRVVADGEWREDSRSQQWVGRAVAQALALDDVDQDARVRVKAMVARWLQAGALKRVERPGPNRIKRTFIEVGEWIAGQSEG